MSSRTERELYALWERYAAAGTNFTCRDGERVLVIARGERNRSDGPDYLGAVLIIDGALRVGAVEMHVAEGDWYAHGHDADPAYREVILHIIMRSTDWAADVRGLGLPSLEAAVLGGTTTQGNAIEEARLPVEMVDPAFIAELAWARLLRRATEIVRAEPEIPAQHRPRRAFVRRLYDALGYSANRAAMLAVADLLLLDERRLVPNTFEGVAAAVFAWSAVEPERARHAARGFLPSERLRNFGINCDLPRSTVQWRYNTRPANTPERRLWAAAKLTYDLYNERLFERATAFIRRGSFERAERLFAVRLGGEPFVGEERAREIVVNAFLPAALAAGLLRNDGSLIGAVCGAYRSAPPLGSNRIVRDVESRYGLTGLLSGAFWQQGAIELYQRYLMPDRDGLSFVAEPTP